MKVRLIDNKFDYFWLRNFSELVAKAFFLAEKLHFWKIIASLAVFGGTSVEKFCKLYATILLAETQTRRNFEKALVLWMNGSNYSSFFVVVSFDEIFKQHTSFRQHFHTFYTEISSKTPESVRKCHWKLLVCPKISSKPTLVKSWVLCSFYW